MPFHQDPPRPPDDPYLADPILRDLLVRHLPDDVLDSVEPSLSTLGRLAGGEMLDLADEAHRDEPELVRYDPWGRRADRIEISDAWTRLKQVGAEHGLLADAYSEDLGEHGRLVQAAKIALYHPSSAVASCPLAMADGAARVCRDQADDADDPGRLRDAFDHLTSTDPGEAWVAGQWMTERSGGSDVSGTGTVAEPDGDRWRLTGQKWFASACEAEVAFTLARPEGEDDLALFFVDAASARGDTLHIDRLKDKLGTRGLATAELTLDGVPAVRVGGAGEGVRRIATILNITRTWNALCAAGEMRRALDLAEDYARRREAFGKPLADHPLHVDVLADLETRAAASMHLAMETARRLGRVEAGVADEEETRVLRTLTPITKLVTAKEAIDVISEAIECFGGAGYVEDTGLPRMLRDAQVLPIWEGTTNVLALDATRQLTGGAGGPMLDAIADGIVEVGDAALDDARDTVDAAILRLEEHLASLGKRDPDDVEAGARRLALGVGRTLSASLMIAHAQATGDGRDVDLARRFTRRKLTGVQAPGQRDRAASDRIVFGD